MGHVYRVLAQAEIESEPAHFPKRFVIEDCENIHIHFRNLRIELSVREFIQFTEGMCEALDEFRDFGEPESIPIAQIDPYDFAHPDGFETSDEEHREGIEKIKQLIKDGTPILPILVKNAVENKYIRMDGFKRFMAFKELGYEVIDCYVMENAKLGGQEGMPWAMELMD